MIPSVTFGKNLISAKTAYDLKNYEKANIMLDIALCSNKSDFLANFYKLRVAVMQGNFDVAVSLMHICKELKAASKMGRLLTLWEEYYSMRINQSTSNQRDNDIIALNKETDGLIEYYQHNRVYNLVDILYVSLLFIGASILFILLEKIKLSSDGLSFEVNALIYTIMISYYYYYKAPLVPNFYISLRGTINKIKQLLHSKQFISKCLFIIIGMNIVFFYRPSHFDLERNFLNIIGIIFFFPIFEEILLRGFLYGYLRKYGKVISWIIVTIAFYSLHGGTASSWHIILSLICLKLYDEEKTILAPILIHILNNVLGLLISI